MPKTKLETLTEPMYFTLLALNQPRCGMEITEFVMAVTHDRVRLGPGTLYAMLSKFLEADLIRELPSAGRKRIYQIDQKGRQLLVEEYHRLQNMLEESQPFLEEEQ